MNKTISIMAVVVILIVVVSVAFLKSEKLIVKFNTANISGLDYWVFDGNERKHKNITNKEDISKIIEYINSLALPKTSSRPQDASNSFKIVDNDGNLVKSFAFGESGVLWVDSKTYKLGNSNANNLKTLLLKLDK